MFVSNLLIPPTIERVSIHDYLSYFILSVHLDDKTEGGRNVRMKEERKYAKFKCNADST